MEKLLEAISLLTTLAQAVGHGAQAMQEVSELIDSARAQGRDLTDAELDAARSKLKQSRERLASAA